MLRTSVTHPLQIAAVDAGADREKIGVTFAPGKNDRFAIGGPWARDLDEDLDAIVAWGARTIVTLLGGLAWKFSVGGWNGCTCQSPTWACQARSSRPNGRRSAITFGLVSMRAKTSSSIVVAASDARA